METLGTIILWIVLIPVIIGAGLYLIRSVFAGILCAVVAVSDNEPSNRLGAIGGLIICAIIGICAFAFAKSDILGNSRIP
ncbi:hypothetical protein YZ82_08070 [Campylobacter hyointestinalis]|uniref:Uncharacterized protein n=1 Tax=Campylobacter hyointestinalis TaxID=198 RepID=A0A562X8U0_CAMHY|nr:hypothetical protein [Campylobacter hyointestinalis]TWO18554.1 hypothetical protein YZ82_08070 [Campylobacter hyointestinalis]